jgi:NAD-dependent dihydropyrimidine dehydrogenase PreA subunit
MAHTIDDRCVNCAACEAHCPLDAIRAAEPIFVIVPEACTDCGVCVDICPTRAIKQPRN